MTTTATMFRCTRWALAKVGVKSNVQILQVNKDTVSNWDELTDAVEKATKDSKTLLN